jgi:hypothetical protein
MVGFPTNSPNLYPSNLNGIHVRPWSHVLSNRSHRFFPLGPSHYATTWVLPSAAAVATQRTLLLLLLRLRCCGAGQCCSDIDAGSITHTPALPAHNGTTARAGQGDAAPWSTYQVAQKEGRGTEGAGCSRADGRERQRRCGGADGRAWEGAKPSKGL